MPLPIGLFSPVRHRAPVALPQRRPDPLTLSLANGTSFTAVDRNALAAEASRALKLGADVPGRVQDGPTCGLYALGMVMDYWEQQNPSNGLDPLVQRSGRHSAATATA